MNKDYTIKVEKINFEDGSFEWVASFYELPGIIGVGDSPFDALNEANQAKEAFISACVTTGDVIPVPLNEINYSGRTTVRMSKRLHQLSNEIAIQEGVSLNQLIVDAISAYVYPVRKNVIKTQKHLGSILLNEE